MKPIHRDDVPFEIVEEIQKKLEEAHPGKKVTFAGDTGDQEIIEKAELAHRLMAQRASVSYAQGSCIDCGAVMPEYEERLKTKQIAENWAHFADQNDEFMGWVCPECRCPDGRQEIRPIFLEDDEE